MLTIERATPEDSAQWACVDAAASPGFIILLVIAGAAFVAQLALRLAGETGETGETGKTGKTGKATGLIIAPIGDPAPTNATDGADNVEGLLPALRHNSYVGFGVLTALLVVTAILVATVANAWHAWDGNHGRGGRNVTIVSDPLGGSAGAYLVGGHAYLFNLFLGLGFLLLELAVLGYAAYRIRSERRRRNEAGTCRSRIPTAHSSPARARR